MPEEDWVDLLDAIREKGGTSALMTSAQAKAAVEAIETGGGADLLAKDVTDVGYTYSNHDITTFRSQAFNNSPITAIDAPNVTTIGTKGFSYADISTAFFPKARPAGSNVFEYGQNLTTVVWLGTNNVFSSMFYYSKKLKTVDLISPTRIGNNDFSGCDLLDTLIIRSTSIPALGNANAFNNVHFKSGGTGGTIYIPKSLYDQLGTGANDYQSESNWSVVHGYGTITWAQIEGSIYETQYADGTPIT